jgi:hypothetical protein
MELKGKTRRRARGGEQRLFPSASGTGGHPLAPPFRTHCVYTDVELERRLREAVAGDLSGVLETFFREDPDEGGTHITFT